MLHFGQGRFIDGETIIMCIIVIEKVYVNMVKAIQKTMVVGYTLSEQGSVYTCLVRGGVCMKWLVRLVV